MRTWTRLIRLILILLLCLPCSAANDFSGDGNCVGLWTFDDAWNGSDAQDTSGNSNDLSNTSCTRDTTNVKEGTASCNKPAGAARLERADADLSSNFPGKNGQGNTTWSFVGWVYWPGAFLGSGDQFVLASKYYTGKRQYNFHIENDAGTHRVILTIGYNNGISYERVINYTGLTFAADQWYHCAFTYNGSSKAAHIRVWDETNTTVHDDTATGAQTISDAEDQPFRIGGNGWLSTDEGVIDEAVMFNDILTSTEIDQIRAGTYGAASGAQVIGGGSALDF